MGAVRAAGGRVEYLKGMKEGAARCMNEVGARVQDVMKE